MKFYIFGLYNDILQNERLHSVSVGSKTHNPIYNYLRKTLHYISLCTQSKDAVTCILLPI